MHCSYIFLALTNRNAAIEMQYVKKKYMYVVTYPCPNWNGNLAEPPLELEMDK